MARLALLWKVAMLMTEIAGVQAAGPPHGDVDSNCLLQLAVEDVAGNAASAGGANATDLFDYAMLAAHTGYRTNLTPSAFADLGWDSGLTVNFNNGLDTVNTFYKNGTCLITFSALNDAIDTAQVLTGAAYTKPMCEHTVHGGVVEDLESLMSTTEFNDVTAFMNDARCTEAVAAGASFGGAIAGLWAACAGRNASFGSRSDYRLVMIGTFALSTPALTKVGNVSFEGTRYALTEPDGGVSATAGVRGNFTKLALDGVQLLSDYVNATFTDQREATVQFVDFVHTSLSNAPDFLATWNLYKPQLAGLWLHMFGGVFSYPTAASSQPLIGYLMSQIYTGIFDFEYDAIPPLFNVFGLEHPSINFQPLPNPLKAVGASMDMVPATDSSVTTLPEAEFVQSGFAILAGGGWFPNHDTCCYIETRSGTCEEKYTLDLDGGPLRMCFNTTLAFLSQFDQSSVVGDPHVVNVAKVKFEIRAEGVHKLVQIPRFIKSNVKPDLRVDAEIQHLDDCDKSFMTSLSILGRWTEDSFGLVRISPGSNMPNTTLLVNTKGPEEFFKQFPHPGVKAGRESVMFKLRDVGFHVAKHFEGRYGKQRAYLNLRIVGLKQYKDLGGLLGYDGHEDAEKPSAGCSTAAQPPAANRSSLIGSGRSAPSTDGGSRIEAE